MCERATRPERAGAAVSEGACRGVRGAKPLGLRNEEPGILPQARGEFLLDCERRAVDVQTRNSRCFRVDAPRSA